LLGTALWHSCRGVFPTLFPSEGVGHHPSITSQPKLINHNAHKQYSYFPSTVRRKSH